MMLKLSNEPKPVKPDEATTGETSPLKHAFLNDLPDSIKQDFIRYQQSNLSSNECYRYVIKPLRYATNIPIKVQLEMLAAVSEHLY